MSECEFVGWLMAVALQEEPEAQQMIAVRNEFTAQMKELVANTPADTTPDEKLTHAIAHMEALAKEREVRVSRDAFGV